MKHILFINKNRILEVNCGCVIGENELFLYSIYLCDEFGLHENTLGITKEFAEYLIKELNLEKSVEKDENGEVTRWKNPIIKQDEKGKKLAGIEKEIKIKSLELQKLIRKKMECI